MLITGIFLALITLIDDLWGLSVPTRFLSQALACLILVTQSGLYIDNLGNLFGLGSVELNPALGVLFTIFCVVGITNAFNWIDGIDGFFSFQVLIALIGLAIIGRAGFTLAHLSLLAALLPYSLMNLGLFGKKFKVFIGDHGAMMIGFFLACSFVFLTQDPLNEYESLARPDEALWCDVLFLLNAFRHIPNEHVRCSYSFAYQKRNQT